MTHSRESVVLTTHSLKTHFIGETSDILTLSENAYIDVILSDEHCTLYFSLRHAAASRRHGSLQKYRNVQF